MRIFKKYVFEIESKVEQNKIEMILDKYNIEYDSNADESGIGFIETYSVCPDECIEMINAL